MSLINRNLLDSHEEAVNSKHAYMTASYEVTALSIGTAVTLSITQARKTMKYEIMTA